jgi:integrase
MTTSRYTRRRPEQLVARGVYRSSSGLYEINYRDSAGKLHWKTTGRSLIEAKAVRAALTASRGRNRKTVAWAGQRWLKELDRRVTALELSESTRERYRSAYLNWIEPGLGRQPVARLGARRLSQFWDEIENDKPKKKGVTASGGRLIRTVLCSLLTYCVQEALLSPEAFQVLDAVRPTAGATEQPAAFALLSAEDAEVLLAGAPSDWRLPLQIALSTGIRTGELLGLRWRDLSGNTVTIGGQLTRQRTYARFPAGDQRQRTLSLPPPLAEALAQKRAKSADGEGDALVFSNRRGDGLSQRALELAFRQAVASAGLDPSLTFHALRDHYVNASTARGQDFQTIARQLGHRSAAAVRRRYQQPDSNEGR